MHDKISEKHPPRPEDAASLAAGLSRLATAEEAPASLAFGARLRNYLLTGLVVVGPLTITLYIAWWFINAVDAAVKPFLPHFYNPDTYLPFPVPGIGLVIALAGLIVIGALAANLLGRTLISFGEVMLGRTPIVRNVYQALKQIFESVITASNPSTPFQKVGLLQFPSKGIWSIVFVTSEASGEIRAVAPGGEDLVCVFMPTAIVPPTGFVCFVPRSELIFLSITVEDAAKIIISAGMVMPEYQEKLARLAEEARKPPRVRTPEPQPS